MSTLCAYIGNDPQRVACALFSARSALVAREGAPAGWGLGFVQAGDVLLQKKPRVDSGEVDVYALARGLEAEALMGSIAPVTDPPAAVEDRDPFRFRSWLFATLGAPQALDGAREKLLESVPDFLRRNIRGQSPSEHLFHLFLAFLHDAGLLDNPSPEPGPVARALHASATYLDRLVQQAGVPLPQMVVVASNGRTLVALPRRRSLQALEVAGIADCPVCRRAEDGKSGRRVSHDGLRAVIVQADGAGTLQPGWRVIEPGAALLVGRGATLQVVAADSIA